MMSAPVMLAQAPLAPPPSGVSPFLLSDTALIIGALLVLGAVLVTWVIIIRGPKSDISPARRVYKGHPAPDAPAPAESSSGRHRKKKRTRRREHRSRNPTLSETGGLPPPRGPEAPLIP